MNKRAQGMSINTVVLLILAVIVLVVIIAGFTMGWGNMWERVQLVFSKGNLDAVVSTCSIQCTTNQVNEYCNVPKNVRGADKEPIGIPDGPYTCNKLKGELAGKKPNLDDCTIEC